MIDGVFRVNPDYSLKILAHNGLVIRCTALTGSGGCD
jgi:hypothetical protein